MNYKHGKAHTRLNRIYRGMKTRCYNKNHDSYKYYGAKGVTICDEWLKNFSSFYDWAMDNGYSDTLSIDKDILCDKLKISPKIYSPSTCMWATKTEQVLNVETDVISNSNVKHIYKVGINSYIIRLTKNKVKIYGGTYSNIVDAQNSLESYFKNGTFLN